MLKLNHQTRPNNRRARRSRVVLTQCWQNMLEALLPSQVVPGVRSPSQKYLVTSLYSKNQFLSNPHFLELRGHRSLTSNISKKRNKMTARSSSATSSGNGNTTVHVDQQRIRNDPKTSSSEGTTDESFHLFAAWCDSILWNAQLHRGWRLERYLIHDYDTKNLGTRQMEKQIITGKRNENEKSHEDLSLSPDDDLRAAWEHDMQALAATSRLVYRCNGSARWTRKATDEAEDEVEEDSAHIRVSRSDERTDQTQPDTSSSSSVWLDYTEEGSFHCEKQENIKGDHFHQVGRGATNATGTTRSSLPFQQTYRWHVGKRRSSSTGQGRQTGSVPGGGAASSIDGSPTGEPDAMDDQLPAEAPLVDFASIYEHNKSANGGSGGGLSVAETLRQTPLAQFESGSSSGSRNVQRGEDNPNEMNQSSVKNPNEDARISPLWLSAVQNTTGGFLCGKDRYEAWLRLPRRTMGSVDKELPKPTIKSFRLRYRIRGPNKNYISDTVYVCDDS
ncbi:unnamed protein product [Amoebophrya sp. A120]|nr:unnamed protein product [Amoebophrya sp. A120]|eukprot:GSA120T00000695001.1